MKLSKHPMDQQSSDEDADTDFDTQIIIQQSLLDAYKPELTGRTPEDERSQSFSSEDYKKIVEAIETVKYSSYPRPSL